MFFKIKIVAIILLISLIPFTSCTSKECKNLPFEKERYQKIAAENIETLLKEKTDDCQESASFGDLMNSCYSHENIICNSGITDCEYVENKLKLFDQRTVLKEISIDLSVGNGNQKKKVFEHFTIEKCQNDDKLQKILEYPIPLRTKEGLSTMAITFNKCLPKCN